jgi:hypothetical protein
MVSVISFRNPGGYGRPFPREYQADLTPSASATRLWVNI